MSRSALICCHDNAGQLASVLRGRYLVDVEPYGKVEGLPFFAAELEQGELVISYVEGHKWSEMRRIPVFGEGLAVAPYELPLDPATVPVGCASRKLPASASTFTRSESVVNAVSTGVAAVTSI